jgi:uncharacterized membrane protein
VPSRTLFPVVALALASAWCVVLLAVRGYAFGDAGYPYLVWNLTLAWVPLALALLLVAAYRRRAPRAEQLALGFAWLLFLPNAPYVLTDFVHLGDRHKLFDSVLLTSFAFTALALGFASLLLVQLVVTRAAGALLGWTVAFSSLFLSSVGIYLGRVHRLNSWDVLQRPRFVGALLRTRLDDPLGNRYLIGFVFAICGFLMLLYTGLLGFAALASLARRDDRPPPGPVL